jgi:hypothetical protein
VQWQRAWQGFEAAWALGKHLGAVIECGTVTPTSISMATDQAVAFCLPANEDEGLLAKALVVILAQAHNSLRDLTQTHLRTRAGKHADSVPEPAEESSKAFSRTDLVHKKRASVEAALAAFIEFVRRQCLVYSQETGKLEYDLDAAERFLADEFFAACPKVKVELDMIQCVNVLFLVSTSYCLSSLS